MLFYVNQLLEFVGNSKNPEIARVLYIDAQIRRTALIRIDAIARMPFWEETNLLEIKISGGEIIPLKVDHVAPRNFLEADLDEKTRERRDAAWQSIKPLVTGANLVKMLYPRERAKLIIVRVKETGISRITIYNRIRRYWQRGQTINTQLPDFINCGSTTNRKIGEKKLGRPSLLSKHDGRPLGVNIDQGKKKILIDGAKMFYENESQQSYNKAWRDMLRHFFKIGYELKDGVLVPQLPSKEDLPTLNQFKYHYLKDLADRMRLKEALIARHGVRKYNLGYREVAGSSTEEAFGPGSVFQVDATIADAYFRSRYNPNNIIRRLTIWVIIDVFSRLIVGFCVRPEREGWLGLSLAIENATTDKVKYCAQYGIKIELGEWPSGLCELLSGDNRIKTHNTTNLVNNLGIRIRILPPYRADWKGVVEHYFHYLNIRFIHQLPGFVDKDHGRGGIDYRLLSALNIDDFTRIALKVVLQYNKWHYMNHYDLDEFMIMDNIQPYPIDLWNWGIVNRQGHLRSRDPETIRVNLLPSATAKVTEKGIRFASEFYTCEKAESEGWFLRARNNGVWEIPVIYDPRRPGTIYLRPRDGQSTIQCHPRNLESAFKKYDLAELTEYQGYKKIEAQRSESDRLQADVETDEFIESISKNAIKTTKEVAIPCQSKRSKTAAIRENSKTEQQQIHQEEIKSIYGPSDKDTPADQIVDDNEYVPFPTLDNNTFIQERIVTDGKT